MLGEMILLVIGAVLSFFAVCGCAFAKSSERNRYCAMASVSALIYFSVSYLILYCKDLDQFIMLQKLSLTSGLYMLIGSAFAISYMFRIDFTNRTKIAVALVSFGFVIMFLTFGDMKPWAKEIFMIHDEQLDLYYYALKGGWFYYVLNGIVLVAFITWIIVTIVITASKKGRQFRLFRYLLGFAMLPLFVWIFSVFGILKGSICNEIVFMLLLIIVIHVEIFMSFTIQPKQYSDLLFKNSDKGIIILDYKKRYVLANTTAEQTFDIFAKNNKDAITAFINVNLIGEKTYFDGNDHYSVKLETISNNDNPREGYAIWIEKLEKNNTQD